ncbi:MAG: hypothetical protein ACON49_00630 [Candidatus Puniceispirillaceae bacterium]
MTIKNSIIILGAGSSKEYGLPLWNELADKMISDVKLRDAKTILIKYPGFDLMTDEYLEYSIAFIEKVKKGVQGGEYSTIDEAISDLLAKKSDHPLERIYTSRFMQTPSEALFWFLMNLIFHQSIIGGNLGGCSVDTFLWLGNHQTLGWLRFLIGEPKTLDMQGTNNIVIDFNYDDLFYSCYSYLTHFPEYYSENYIASKSRREREIENRMEKIRSLEEEVDRLRVQYAEKRDLRQSLIRGEVANQHLIEKREALEALKNNNAPETDSLPEIEGEWRKIVASKNDLNIFQPHGYFSALHKNQKLWKKDGLKIIDPNKGTHSYRGSEPISCYDTVPQNFSKITEALEQNNFDKLIVMGVGPESLPVNFEKITFEAMPSALNEIWFTCYEDEKKQIYVDYFRNRFGNHISLKMHKTCTDLAKALSAQHKEN